MPIEEETIRKNLGGTIMWITRSNSLLHEYILQAAKHCVHMFFSNRFVGMWIGEYLGIAIFFWKRKGK